MNLIDLIKILPESANIVVYQPNNRLVWNSEKGNDLNEEQKNYNVKSLEAGFIVKNNRIQYEIYIDGYEI